MNKKVQKRSVVTFILSFLAMTVMTLFGGNANAQTTGGSELSLDNVTVTSFKIIDVANGNKEVDYKTGNSAQYEEYKNEPSKFNNAINIGQITSKFKYQLSISYKGQEILKEGDTLVIPATFDSLKSSFSSKKLLDGENHELGTWEYKDGNVVIHFSGDYIKNNQVKSFTASFETGENNTLVSTSLKTTKLGERYALIGTIGKEKFVAAREKFYIVAERLNDTTNSMFKSAPQTTDSRVWWKFNIESDRLRKSQNGKNYDYYNPYMLENNGKYTPKTLTDIYIEDTFEDVIEKPDSISIVAFFSGIDDDGKVVSGSSGSGLPASTLKKVEQEGKTKAEVKASLKNGEYSIYDNKDGSYTLMLKWWDTNDSTGPTYDDIPAVKNAGGVGNFLKTSDPDIYGSLKPETIEKMNNIYKGKAIQNFFLVLPAKYKAVKETKVITNTVKITTKQTGEVTSTAKATLTPSIGVATDPLSVKLIKTDVETGLPLSEGFKFELQTTDDNGTTWKPVTVTANMVVSGTLNGDNTLTPDETGVVELNSLVSGKKYRFVEKAHGSKYQDVKEDNTKPNTEKTPTAANSRVVEISNQGTGKVIVMYNQQKPETIKVEGSKTWDDADNQDGKRPSEITVHLLKNGQKVASKTVTEADGWKWAFDNLDKYENGKEITYTVEEEAVEGYTTKVNGFNITNTYTPAKTSVQVTKKWDDADNQDGKRPAQITVNLLKNGQKVASKTVTEADGWKWTFDNLDKYENGKEITYTVEEEAVEGYTSKVNGFNITNTYAPAKTSVQVTKKWDDADDKDGKRPTSVTITLYANGEKTDKTLVLNKENNWTGSFTEVDEYKAGKKIDYSVQEEPVGNGYVSEISGNQADGFTVTNTRKPDVPVTPETPTTPVTTTTEEGEKELPNTGTVGSLAVFGVLALIGAGLVLSVKTKKA